MQLHETMYGRRFFEGQLPDLIKSLDDIRNGLLTTHRDSERLASLKEAELEMKHKELDLRQKELDLKERELLLKEKELDI